MTEEMVSGCKHHLKCGITVFHYNPNEEPEKCPCFECIVSPICDDFVCPAKVRYIRKYINTKLNKPISSAIPSTSLTYFRVACLVAKTYISSSYKED